VREIYNPKVDSKVLFDKSGREDCRWSLEEIRIFLEKVFIYKRDFSRIASFIPMKTFKDVTNFFFAVKKHIELKKHEHALKECLNNKLGLIHRTSASIMENHFNSLESTKHPLVASAAFDQYFQGFSLRDIMTHLSALSQSRQLAPKLAPEKARSVDPVQRSRMYLDM